MRQIHAVFEGRFPNFGGGKSRFVDEYEFAKSKKLES
jgi:hypothetical protein